jgi:hypothetical protein
MSTEIITLQIDPEAAKAFNAASAEEREKLQVLLGIWLHELGRTESKSLSEVMDEIGNKAKSRGLNAETLAEILKED